MRPGYLEDGDCTYGVNGSEAASEIYLVLTTNDPAVGTTAEARPALEGFDPGAILGVQGVAGFCAQAEGLCLATLPPGFVQQE